MAPDLHDPAGPSSKPPVSFDAATRFIVRVGVAAHGYGATAMRLERLLSDLARTFGYSGVFRSTPSEILIALRERPGAPQHVEIVETAAPNIQLDKLARLGEALRDQMAGQLSLSQTLSRLDDIDRSPPPWSSFAVMLGYAMVAAGLAPILGGGWADTLLAVILSVIVFGLVQMSARLGSVAMDWMPFTTALLAGVLATLAKLWVPDLNVVLVILSAVAIVLPGYTISLGAGELVAQHVASGAANLMTGLVCLAKQVAGAWAGVRVVSLLIPLSSVGAADPVPSTWLWLLFPLLLVGLCLVFQIARRDLLPATLICGISYLGVLAGSEVFGGDLGNVIGTMVAVAASRLWARNAGRPSSIVLIPAIVMLVSGSIGFRGLGTMAQGEFVLGLEQFLHMFVVALTILVGLVIGQSVFRGTPKPDPGARSQDTGAHVDR